MRESLKIEYARRLALQGEKSETAIMQELRPDLDKHSAYIAASRWRNDPIVRLELDRVRSEARSAVVLSLAEKREFLRDVVRAKVSELGPDSPLVSEIVETESQYGTVTRKVKMPDKLRALELDAKLAGEFAPERKEVAVAVNMGRVLESIMFGTPLELDGDVVDVEGDDDTNEVFGGLI